MVDWNIPAWEMDLDRRVIFLIRVKEVIYAKPTDIQSYNAPKNIAVPDCIPLKRGNIYLRNPHLLLNESVKGSQEIWEGWEILYVFTDKRALRRFRMHHLYFRILNI